MLHETVNEGILKKFRIILFLLILAMTLPFIILTFYSVPGADDYTNTLEMFQADGGRWLIKALYSTIDMYQNWQGAFTGVFSVYYGLGIFEKYGMTGLHIQNFVTVTVFFTTYFLSFWSIWKMIVPKKTIKSDVAGLLLFNVILFGFLHNTYIADAFYWRSGSGMYTIPFILLFLSIWVSAAYCRSRKKYLLLPAAVFAFLAAGGSLGISATVCTMYFACVLWGRMKAKLEKGILFVFLSGFAGTMMNVIAPGNYMRHDSYETEYELIKTCWYTLKYSFSVIGEQFSNGIFIVFFIIALLAAKSLADSISIKFSHPWLIVLYCGLSMIAVNFPVCFGYSSDSPNGRAEFVAKAAGSFFASGMLAYLAGYLVIRFQIDFDRNFKIVLGLCCLIAASDWGYPDAWTQQKPFKVYFDLGYGRAEEFYETSLYIIDELKNSESENAVITVKKYDNFDIMRGIGLTPDKDYWANQSIAQYYKRNSAELHIDAAYEK